MPYLSGTFFTFQIEVRSMKNEKKKIHLIKEDEKIKQVTHWDLDYLPKDEILDLYRQGTGNHQQKNKTAHAADETSKRLPLLLIAIGLFLLAGARYVASLT
jgi:hypothetical protein